MAAPEIIGSSRSTYTRAVCMVCEEKGIEYVPTEKPLHAPEIRAIHPFGKMPVLRHGDLELFESKAIATYLDRSFPAPFVFPSEPRLAALTEQWVSLVNTVIDRTIIRTYLFAFIAPGTPTESLIGRRSEPSCRWCARAGRGARQGGRQERLSGRRSVDLRRHQPDADPASHAAGARRRGNGRRSPASRVLLRTARGTTLIPAHRSAPWPAGPSTGGLTDPATSLLRAISMARQGEQYRLGDLSPLASRGGEDDTPSPR
jgi:hypothetical protein